MDLNETRRSPQMAYENLVACAWGREEGKKCCFCPSVTSQPPHGAGDARAQQP